MVRLPLSYERQLWKHHLLNDMFHVAEKCLQLSQLMQHLEQLELTVSISIESSKFCLLLTSKLRHSKSCHDLSLLIPAGTSSRLLSGRWIYCWQTSLQSGRVSATSQTTDEWAVNMRHIIAQLPRHSVVQLGHVSRLAPPWYCHSL